MSALQSQKQGESLGEHTNANGKPKANTNANAKANEKSEQCFETLQQSSSRYIRIERTRISKFLSISSKSFHKTHFINKMETKVKKRLSQKLSRIHYSP